MAKVDRTELLEIYKLHAELADRVSQRREGAHRLYVSLLGGIITLVAVSIRFGTDNPMSNAIEITVLVVGALLSFSWLCVIWSYQQLNSCKFKTLCQLEENLDFQFFKIEWMLLGRGQDADRYRKLTDVESWLPLIFILLFVVLLSQIWLPGVIIVSLICAVLPYLTSIIVGQYRCGGN